jgi:putative ABC transport system permease protein
MKTPPKFITRLIERFTNHRESEIILGDMYEEYEVRIETWGKTRADLAYISDFVSLVFHRVLRKKKQSHSSNFSTMLINYLKVALRQLGRQKVHNFINIIGLAIGLAASFIITLFVVQELSFDRFHTKGDRIHLLPMTWKFGTNRSPTALTTSAAGFVMKDLFSEVETYARIQNFGMTFQHARGPIEENGIIAADSTFFDIFTFPLIAGNPQEALKEPNSVVITENAAVKYFGEDWEKKDVMSQTLVAQTGKVYRITGIAKNVPLESHIQFDVVLSMVSLPKNQTEPNWESASMTTYVLLAPGASAEAIVADIPNRVAKKYGADHNDNVELDLIPMHDVYLKNPEYPGIVPSGNIRYVYIFSAIAVLILVIAIINYMNLSTARSMERAREVGVRKVVGAVRTELFWQFISESILVAFAAVVIALGIAYLLLPIFNNISEKNLSIDLALHPEWIAALIVVWLTISFLGGAYPAMILSSFRPVKVLKGKLATTGSGAMLRKSLVVFQFVISIFLIVCTLTINDQLNFMVHKKIGVDKEQLVAVQLDSLSRANISTIRSEFASITGVERSSSVSSTPINNGRKTTVVGGDIGDKQLILYNIGVDGDFVSTSGLELIAGTDLSREIQKDGRWEYILNESAVEFFGWTNETAIGKKIGLWSKEGVVKGVIKDFHFLPLYRPIEPLLIHAGRGNNYGLLSKVLIRVQGDDMMGTVAAMEERWKKIVPGSPFTLTFLDQMYDKLYRSETRLSRIMNVFSVLAIFIAGLGLFGLASYTIMQRTKELGIRKVLGASLPTLLVDVSGSFVKLVLLACVLAAPISWYAMNSWLQNFPYPVDFSWMLVIVAGVSTLCVAIATVSYHAVEAARVNPVNSLRSE